MQQFPKQYELVGDRDGGNMAQGVDGISGLLQAGPLTQVNRMNRIEVSSGSNE